MTDIYNIPIIARGRIIDPGADAVEYAGRGGAKFRTQIGRASCRERVCLAV